MAPRNNKSDLADLKARLGLTKPEPEPEEPTSPPPPQGPPAAWSPPPGAGPPPTAQRPPQRQRRPGAATSGPPSESVRAPRSQSQPGPSASSRGSAAAPETPTFEVHDTGASLDMSELDAPLKPAGSRVFSAPVLVLLVVMIIIGVVFGVMFKESQQSRSIYMAQTSDASALKEALKPKVAQFEKAAKVVGSLEGDQVAFEEAARLAKLDFTPDDNVFSGGRFLLGPTIMSEVTGYIADATILETMLEHHDRLTNKVDKEELERLIAENEILQNDNQFVVVFNFQHLLENARDDNYLPKPGRLATVERFELNEAGKVDFKLIGDSEVNESPVQGVIPLGKADILKSGGENALQRYRARVQEIKIQASKLEQASRSMLADIDKIAERGDPPLISL